MKRKNEWIKLQRPDWNISGTDIVFASLIILCAVAIAAIATLILVTDHKEWEDSREEREWCISEYGLATMKETPNICLQYFNSNER